MASIISHQNEKTTQDIITQLTTVDGADVAEGEVVAAARSLTVNMYIHIKQDFIRTINQIALSKAIALKNNHTSNLSRLLQQVQNTISIKAQHMN